MQAKLSDITRSYHDWSAPILGPPGEVVRHYHDYAAPPGEVVKHCYSISSDEKINLLILRHVATMIIVDIRPQSESYTDYGDNDYTQTV
jgi:hypothetical protein